MKKFFCALILLLSTFKVTHAQEASLIGTQSSLQKQNAIADQEGLVRISEDEFDQMKDSGRLIKLPQTIMIDERLDQKWQYTLFRTSVFLEDFGVKYIDKFGRLLQINSAVRTVERQLELIHVEDNKNAAPVKKGDEDRRSSHLTGATVDIAKKDMNEEELEWTRKRLLELETLGLIEATEEWNQLVFHVMVFNTYLGYRQATQ